MKKTDLASSLAVSALVPAGILGANAEDTKQTKIKTEEVRSFTESSFSSYQEQTVEYEFSKEKILLEGETCLQLRKPIQLDCNAISGDIEARGWGLKLDLGEGADLERHLGKHFLILYRKAIEGSLTNSEEEQLEQISEQVDYDDFCASRELPRYREAHVVRKSPMLIRFLSDKNVKISPEIASKFHWLDEGDHFGAFFRVGHNGQITDIFNALPTPNPDEVLEGYELQEEVDEDFPESLQHLLPTPIEESEA